MMRRLTTEARQYFIDKIVEMSTGSVGAFSKPFGSPEKPKYPVIRQKPLVDPEKLRAYAK